MTISKLILTYILTTLVFFAIDLAWLGIVAKNLYQKYLGHLLGEVNWIAAFVFYFIFITGIFIFAIMPALERNSWTYALLYGSLFGFFTYATYDLTNLATLKDWPIAIVFIDIVWGMVLTGAVATAGYFIGKWIN